ncbi:hypothetical protein GUITHDRAFT_161548 [Guillardia theta CCMP2712]|uniref:LysM domain-containing protein n=1 Tax=Guillardia theta (strain CCMP2712) TaxID=905079 RepID=L1JTJ9_GUITC|nr:hypothetical protein GUITHDRAFT_161548 [Guillardia theta CCMP2712]EKX51525.1 hypothetical protein GUITHDRAFT_161548 [Guillardia theta CCMP2712]|eukprot:XP_005838505.1 hypothetical protein GUITHDRAFT_161548 [Guillardia theta CCMP2712]
MQCGPVLLSLLVLFLSGLLVRVDAQGTFRHGNIHWRSDRNNVHFTVQMGFDRNISGVDAWRGSGSDRLPQLGDKLQLVGRESPVFYYGDGYIETIIQVTVVASSIEEDWVIVEYQTDHEYYTPNNDGSPWLAELAGCCRAYDVSNSQFLEWAIVAQLDLQQSSISPQAFSLPTLTVGASMVNGLYQGSVSVPAIAPGNVTWTSPQPSDVGNAIQFQASLMSYITINLTKPNPGPLITALEGALFANTPGDGTTYYATTFEFWLNIANATGGNIIRVGCDTSSSNPTGCPLNTLYIQVNESHVTVGHEMILALSLPPGSPEFYPDFYTRIGTNQYRYEQAFAICSNALVDRSLCGATKAVGVWFHVSVTRFVLDNSLSYRVMVDGHTLETIQFPAGSAQSRTKYNYCTYFYFQRSCPSFLTQYAKTEDIYLEAGQSYPVIWAIPPQFPNALFFGGSAVTTGKYFSGSLDEFRIWNGALTETAVRLYMTRPLDASKIMYYGDPSVSTGQLTRGAGDTSFLIDKTLIASWSFDQQCNSANPCNVDQTSPSFPTSTSARAYLTGTANAVMTGPIDGSGKMYLFDPDVKFSGYGELTFRTNYSGNFTVSPTITSGRNSIRIDLVINVIQVDSSGLIIDPHYPGNYYMPSLQILMKKRSDTRSEQRVIGQISGDNEQETSLSASDQYPNRIRVFAGNQVTVKLIGTDAQASTGSTATWVRFAASPVPATATISPTYGSNPANSYITWRPCLQDEGSHIVCVEAIDHHSNAVGTIQSVASKQQCFELLVSQVRAPTLQFSDSTGRPLDTINATIGKQFTFQAQVQGEDCQSAVQLEPENGLPPEATLTLLSSGQQRVGLCQQTTKQFSWVPPLHMGGFDSLICFRAFTNSDSCTGPTPMTVSCVRVTVRRCVYSLQQDQQLQELAAMFGTDWMKLWSFNMDLRHPDYLVYQGQTIRVGVLYKTHPNELPEQVAKRMGMTITQLQNMNFDIVPGTFIPDGSVICTIPNSCLGLV